MSWYYPREPPKPVRNGIKAKSKRGKIGETWWSQRWVKVLKSFHMGARLDRGRSYARKGQVVSIDVQKGAVYAEVQGTRKNPYTVRIELPVLSDDEWDTVTGVMASQALFAARLLSGEMPKNIEDAFYEADMCLFPSSKEELDTDCSCPDWANPCKHIAAVYFLLAEQFDEDPFLIFTLRGRTKEDIIKVLREKRVEKLPVEGLKVFKDEQPDVLLLEECLDIFWEAGGELTSFVTNPVAPPTENATLKRLGEVPFTVKGDIPRVLSEIYDAVSAAALQKASEEGEMRQSDCG